MPELISECGDFLLFGFMSIHNVGDALNLGLLMLLLCVQVSLIGMLKPSSGAFMSGEVIFLPVVLSAGTMCMGGEVTVLRRDLL